MIGGSEATELTFSIVDVRCSNGRIIPIMCTSQGSGFRIEPGVMKYVRFLRARGDALVQIRSRCFALGLLRDFYEYAWHGDLARPRGFVELVAAFLRARRSGLIVQPSDDRPTLRWSSVRHETARRDRLAIAEFAAFCVSDFDTFSVLPLDPTQAQICKTDLERLLVLKAPVSRTGDLFHHLSSFRGLKTHLAVRGLERGYSRRRGARSKHHLLFDSVRKMIDLTKSPMQRMMLIEAFFGGPRLSELLNQWRCDVLPGRNRPDLFPDDQPNDVVLVVLAHPSLSTYTGSSIAVVEDRLQHLARFYRRTPRTLLEGSAEAAGWKGIAFDNPNLLISQLFWVNHEYARWFKDIYWEVQNGLYVNIPTEVMQSHPYMYVNDDPGRSEFGRPIKISNARKIFQRAIDRVDTIGPEYKTGSHGARHFYKSVLEMLLPNQKDDIAKCMHHISVDSQDDYAKNSMFARMRLNAALKEAI